MSFGDKFEAGLATISDYTNYAGEMASGKKEFIIKQSVNVVLLLVILLAFGCFDFLHLKFHYEYLLDPHYWSSIVLKTVADICAYNIGINMIIDEVIKRNRVLGKLKYVYNNLNEYKQNDFPDFIFEYNREQRVLAYKNKMTYKIYKLTKRAKLSDKILYNKNPDSDNKYCKKRKKLEYLRSDEYIKNNIDSLDINYKDIEPAVFDIEINGAQKIVQNNVTGSIGKGRLIASTTAASGIILFSIFANSFSLAPNQEEFENQIVAAVNTAVRIATDIGIIIWQFFRGVLSTHGIVSKQMTMPLEERVKILKKYFGWRQNKGLEVPQFYLDIMGENEIKEIEMTEEQYKEYLKSKENNL